MRRNVGVGMLMMMMVVFSGCEKGQDIKPITAGTAGDGQLQSVLGQIKNALNVPAVGAMLIIGDSIIEVDAIGDRVYGTGDRVSSDDKWHIGSMTKSMTATVAARLIEEGKISWTTTIGEIFDDQPIREQYEDIRLEELFYHTAGIINDITRIPSWSEDRALKTDIMPLRRKWSYELLNFEPDVFKGTFLYSNGGYIIAGAMLEDVTGLSWEELMQEYIFTPLDMTNTGFGSPGTVGPVVEPYGHYQDGNIWIGVEPGPNADNPKALGPAGTVHSTMRDFAEYLKAHLKGARGTDGLVTAESFEKLQTTFPGKAYAMGWVTGSNDGNKIISHNGSNTIWFAEMRLSPDQNNAIMVVTNAGGNVGQNAIFNVMEAMKDRFDNLQ